MNQGVLVGVGNVTNSGTLPIGTQIAMQDVGPTITLPDSSVWLRAGTYVTPAYAPQLAAIKNYRLVGTPSVTPIPSSVTVIQVASNGSGTLVASTSLANTIYRSTDNGANWSAVLPAMANGSTYEGVVYGGGKFVMAFWYPAGSAAYFCNSTDGLTWTFRGAITNLTGKAGSIRLVYSNSRVVGTCAGYTAYYTTTNCFTFYSTDLGATCVIYNNGASLNGSMNANAANGQGLLIQGNNSVIVVYPSYVAGGQQCPWVYSLDSGNTWSSVTPNAQSGYYVAIGINGSAVCAVVNGIFNTWANLSSPATYTTQTVAALVGFTPNYSSTPIVFFTTGGAGANQKTFGYSGFNYVFQMSNDLLTISPNSTTQLLNQYPSVYYVYTPIATSDYVVSQYTTNNITTIFDSSLSAYNSVGIKNAGWISNTGSNSYYNGQTWYVRAK